MLPAEIIEKIFEMNYSTIGSCECCGLNTRHSQGYLINKYFTKSFFVRMLTNVNEEVIQSMDNMQLSYHVDLVKSIEIFSYPGLLRGLCFLNCTKLSIQNDYDPLYKEYPSLKERFPSLKILNFIINAYYLINMHGRMAILEEFQFINELKLETVTLRFLNYGEMVSLVSDIVVESVHDLVLDDIYNQSMLTQLCLCFPNCKIIRDVYHEHDDIPINDSYNALEFAKIDTSACKYNLDFTNFKKLEILLLGSCGASLTLPSSLKVLKYKLDSYDWDY